MNFFNRAIKNVTRKLSKSILLVLTFFLIGNLVIIGLSVAKASDSAKTLARQKMRAVVNYEIDYDKFYRDAEAIEDEDERNEFYKHYPQITLSDVREIAKDERVKTANCISNYTIYTYEGGIDYVHLNNQAEANMEEWGGEQCWVDMDGEQYCETYKEPSFFVKSNILPNMIEFVDGDYSLVKGRFYTEEEINGYAKVCLITSELAEANNVTVGDTVKLMYQNLDSYYKEAGITEDELVMELEVIGIYDHKEKITPDSPNYDYTYPYENFDNVILMPSSTMFAFQLPVDQKMWDHWLEQYPDDEYYSNPENRPTLQSIDSMNLYNVVLLLNDPLEVDNFVEEYKQNITANEYKKLNANNEEFNRLAKPLDTLSSYAEFIVWLVVINAVVIITLVTALTLKTREYEIGVLLSVGASKIKVIAQFFVELAIVALLGFTLAVGSGSIISKNVGMKLLDNQIQSDGLNEDDQYVDDWISPWNSDYTTDISLEDIISEYDVTVSPIIIGEIYIVGLGIVLVSVLIPSIMIMRFNPKKILMNQY